MINPARRPAHPRQLPAELIRPTAQVLDEATSFYETLVVELQRRQAVDCRLRPFPAALQPADEPLAATASDVALR